MAVTAVSNSLILGGWVDKRFTKKRGGKVGDNNIMSYSTR